MTKTIAEMQVIRRQALGEEPADLVIKDATILNVLTGDQTRGDIAICGDRIVGTYDAYRGKVEIDGSGLFAAPGFINRHVHIDSGALNPYEYDRLVLPRGTTTAFWCPHEIANVCGAAGLEYALHTAAETVMDLKVQVSSSVPAVGGEMETSGAELYANDIRHFRAHPKAFGLGELMSTNKLVDGDADYFQKLIDYDGTFYSGHMPLERGHRLNTYCALGICDCHETTSLEEGREKLRKGLAVLIREGTLCKNLKDLFGLIDVRTAPYLSFCTDDRKPNDIAREGDIDHLVRSAIRMGGDLATVYRIASLSAAENAGIRDLGLIAPGYRADILLLDDFADVRVEQVIRGGRVVDSSLFDRRRVIPGIGYNSVRLKRDVLADDLALPGAAGEAVAVIGLIPDQIVTEYRQAVLPVEDGIVQPDLANDILKIAVLERHGRSAQGNIGVSFVQGFGLADGAVASTVSHDAHNLVVIGTNDADMAVAANRARDIQGGFVVVKDGEVIGQMALPLGGLMCDHGTSYETVIEQLDVLYAAVGQLEPGMDPSKVFLAASFAPLCVIPAMGVSDCGPIRYDVLGGDERPVLLQDQRQMLGLGRNVQSIR